MRVLPSTPVSGRTRPAASARAFAQPVTAHDLEQAGMIGKAEHLRGPRDVPVMFLERIKHNLPLGLCLQRLERPGRRGDISGVVALLAPNLRRDISRPDGCGIGRDHHPFQAIPQLSDVVPSPVVRRQQCERVRGDRLRAHAKVRGERSKEMIDERRDVGQALAQRRYTQRVDVEAIVKILAAATGPSR